MTVHDLKTHVVSFGGILTGAKTHEWRRDDRGFVVGDVLHLREWDGIREEYTGRDAWQLVTFKTNGGEFGVPPGFCVLSVKPTEPR